MTLTKMKVMEALLQEFHFIGSCSMAAYFHEDIQCIANDFSTACRFFSLGISLSKAEAMYQPAPSKALDAPQPTLNVINGTEINRDDLLSIARTI